MKKVVMQKEYDSVANTLDLSGQTLEISSARDHERPYRLNGELTRYV